MSRKSGSIGLRLRRGKSVSQARGEDVFALLYDNSGQSSAGAVVESSVELTPSPHGSFLRHYHDPCVSSCRALVWLDQFLRARLMLATNYRFPGTAAFARRVDSIKTICPGALVGARPVLQIAGLEAEALSGPPRGVLHPQKRGAKPTRKPDRAAGSRLCRSVPGAGHPCIPAPPSPDRA
jgi:hypothetical protein